MRAALMNALVCHDGFNRMNVHALGHVGMVIPPALYHTQAGSRAWNLSYVSTRLGLPAQLSIHVSTQVHRT